MVALFAFGGLMTRGKKYSPEDIERGLEALAEHGGNAAAASRVTNIPATTLRGWKTEEFVDEFVDLRREKRSDLIEKVWQAASEALKQVLEKMSKASAKDAAVIMGILVDKGLLLGGEPTEITEQLPRIVFRGIDEAEYEEREQE